MSPHPRAHRVRALQTTAAIAGLLASACAAPPARPLRPDEALQALAERTSPETLGRVLEDREWRPSLLALPGDPAALGPRDHGYWLVRAAAFSADVRAALREWRAVRAARSGAGAMEPAQVQVDDHELGGDDPLIEGIAVFDVIGLLGLGPARAESERATAEEAEARAALEETLWRAWLDVTRARVRCAAARARVDALEALEGEGRIDLRRVEILERTGRMGGAPAEAARGAASEIARRLSVARQAAARLAEALEERVGLEGAAARAADGALHPLGGATAAVDVADWFARAELRDLHPSLQRARAAWVTRETLVREAAASAWPGVALGPHIGRPDEVNVGAVLRLRIPAPARWRAAVDEAVERRDASVEAYEDLLHALRQRAEAAAAVEREARARLGGPTAEVVASSEARWDAVRARFRVGRAAPDDWTETLRHRVDAVVRPIDDAETIALARLDLVEALGAAASPFAAAPAGARPGAEVQR